MQTVSDFVRSNVAYLSAGAVGVGLTWIVWKRSTKRTRKCGIDYPKDTVILHNFPSTKRMPSVSHFVMKLETYLRIAKIPYQVDFNYQNSPKGKIPWIEYNGVTMGDSQLIMEFLNKEFSVNINEHLSAVERSQAWAIQKWLEEFTYWLSVGTRWIIFPQETFSDVFELSRTEIVFVKLFVKPVVFKCLYYVGIGRHSNDEIQAMLTNDISHFATILGDKKYLMGDEVSEVDCAAFGILSEIGWATPAACPGRQLLLGQQNIVDYLDRIKNTFWPDWNLVIKDQDRSCGNNS